MNVLLLTSYGVELELIFAALAREGDVISIQSRPLEEGYDYGADFIVSYGYRHIIREPWLSAYKHRLINIHISYLPYNRGASPNLWAWYEGTPHGASIHEVVEKVDAGPVLCRRLVHFPDPDSVTLRSSYQQLNDTAGRMFADNWPLLRLGQIAAYPNRGVADSFHTQAQSEKLLLRFPRKYDTICGDVARAGGHETVNSMAAL